MQQNFNDPSSSPMKKRKPISRSNIVEKNEKLEVTGIETNEAILTVVDDLPSSETVVKTFEEIAKDIIKKSIRSAVCIDDIFIEPYMANEKIESLNKKLSSQGLVLDLKTPSNLYKSFRKEGECDLDIYNFESLEESWHPEYILNNKDLVILDWELEGADKFTSTLIILKKIIEDDKIPFVIIYTQKPKEDFFEISKHLISNFNEFNEKTQPEATAAFYAQFEEHLLKISSDELWEEDKIELFWDDASIKGILLDYLLVPSKKKNSLLDLKARIKEEFNITGDLDKKFKTILKSSLNITNPDDIELLVYLLLESINGESYKLKRIEIEEIGFRINNCVVTLFSKPNEEGTGVNPENVFTQFSNLICKSPHNFITILSLEMRDRFREDLSRIGNNISQIDERAFFHHLEHYKSRSADNYENLFFDFLLNSWTNELSDYNINLKPDSFQVINDYRQKNNLTEIKGDEIKEDLANLAHKLSTTNLVDRLTRDNKIRFGDIFKINNGDDGSESEYLLSITPHCVCLDSCKIDNNFYFIKSEGVSEIVTSALKYIETQHYSFISETDKIKTIKWGDCKPFTAYIKKNELNNIETFYMGQKIKLEYVTTLKENFAQRIANKSFNYGMSIGIDLPNLSK
jgi:hypothetical protein